MQLRVNVPKRMLLLKVGVISIVLLLLIGGMNIETIDGGRKNQMQASLARFTGTPLDKTANSQPSDGTRPTNPKTQESSTQRNRGGDEPDINLTIGSGLYYPNDEVNILASIEQLNTTDIEFTIIGPDDETIGSPASQIITTKPHQHRLQPDNHTVGLWHFDEEYGDTAVDISGYDNDATLNNGPRWVEGKLGGSLRFDGDDDYGRVADSDEISGGANLTLTVETWFKLLDSIENENLVTKFENSERKDWGLMIQQGNLTFYSEYSSEDFKLNDDDSGIITNEWYHCAFVADDSTLQLYLNGELVASSSSFSGHSRDTSDPMHLAVTGYGVDWGYTNVLLDELRISDIARSTDEFNLFQRAEHSFRLGNQVKSGNYTVYANDSFSTASAMITFEIRGLKVDTDREQYYQGDNVTLTANYYNSTEIEVIWEVRDPENILLDSMNATTSHSGWEHELDQNTKALWHLNEGEGTTINDSSGNGYHGTAGVDLDWVTGKDGSALDFDGDSNDKISIENAFALTGSFSIALWIKADNPSSGSIQYIFTKERETDCNGGREVIKIWLQSDNLYWYIRDGDGGEHTTNIGFDDTSWHHILMTYDGSTMRGYLDDSSAPSRSVPSFCNSNDDWIFGQYFNSASNPFYGKVDDIKISDIARTPTDYNPYMSSAAASFKIPHDAKTGPWSVTNFAVNGTITDNTNFEVKPRLNLETGGTTAYVGGGMRAQAEYYQMGDDNVLFTLVDEKGEIIHSENVSTTTEGWEYEPDEYTAGLWHFNEGTSNNARDESENSNDGTLQNEPTWTLGKIDKGVRFDGLDDSILVSDDDSLRLYSDYTISFWFNFDDFTDEYNRIIEKSTTNEGHMLYDVSIRKVSGDYKLYFRTYSESNVNQETTSTKILESYTWYHGAIVVTHDNISLYIDGFLDTTRVHDDSYYGDLDYDDIYFGLLHTKTIDEINYKGILDEIHISDIARESHEFNLYQRGIVTIDFTENVTIGEYTLYANVSNYSVSSSVVVEYPLNINSINDEYSAGDILEGTVELPKTIAGN